MRDEFSIDYLKSRIESPKTASYFEEVYSSYVHGNYRSTVVMLWTIVVFDIFQKLQSLKNSYDDSIATSILNEIDEANKRDNKSSAWEFGIIKSVCNKTDLIEDSELKNLEYLQQQRHLCAHPIMRNGVELYIPNKDTTRSLIRNALEIVLIKPPVYTDKIFENILSDLEKNGINFSELNELKPYIEYKYLNRITTETKLKLFEKFWKFVMRLDNVECNKNRTQNLRFLIILALDKPTEIEQHIKENRAMYNRIEDGNDFIQSLIIFLARAPQIYKLLSEDIKILINLEIEKSLEYMLLSPYTKATLAEHYKYLDNKIKQPTGSKRIRRVSWEILYSQSDSEEMEQNCLRAMSLIYSTSSSFDNANQAMSNIMWFLDKFTIETLTYLLEESEENNQTYGRGQASKDYSVIKKRIQELDKDFDFTKFPKFDIEASREANSAQIA